MKARAHEDSEVEILVAWTQHIAPGDAEEATWDGMFGSNTASQRSYSGWKGKKIQKEVKVQSLNAHSFEGAIVDWTLRCFRKLEQLIINGKEFNAILPKTVTKALSSLSKRRREKVLEQA